MRGLAGNFVSHTHTKKNRSGKQKFERKILERQNCKEKGFLAAKNYRKYIFLLQTLSTTSSSE